MQRSVKPMYRHTFSPAELAGSFSPRFSHPHKRRVYELACPDGPQRSGPVTVSRWATGELGTVLPAQEVEVEARPGVFDYMPSGSGSMDWHLNFADSHLFGFYGGPLLAQDEHQVLEHPALAAVREGLLAKGLAALTVEGGCATPVLVSGVERRCSLSTAPNAAEGRPRGLYGVRFAASPWGAVESALRVLNPPPVSHILAMAAPACGQGRYTARQVREILTIASAGFAAVRAETLTLAGESTQAVIHTGFWGCGAFGGNRVMMAALQLAAARLVGLPRLVFFAYDEAGLEDLTTAQELLGRCWSRASKVDGLVGLIVGAGLEWGLGDGN